MRIDKSRGLTLLFIAFFSFLYVLPLILVDENYSDDVLRATYGNDWTQDGRPLTGFIMRLLSGDFIIKDLFPFNFIVGAFVISFTGYTISKLLAIEKGSLFIFSSFLLLMSPLMIENISYRFDIIPMAISFFLAIIPFKWKHENTKFFIITTLALLALLFIYQASIVMYVLMAILIVMRDSFTVDIKNLITKAFKFFLPLLTSLALMKIISAIFEVSYNNRDQLVFSSENPLSSLNRNFLDIYDLFKGLLSNLHYKLLAGILVIILLYVTIKLLLDKSLQILNKIFLLLLLAVIPLVVISIALFLEETYIAPRIFVGFSFIGYAVLLLVNKYAPQIKLYLIFLWLLPSMALMASYANILKHQHDFHEQIIDDITTNVDIHGKSLIFIGDVPNSENASIALKNNDLLRRLYIHPLGNGKFTFEEYFTLKVNHLFKPIFPQNVEQYLAGQAKIPMVHKTNYYNIRSNDEVVLVDFNKQEIIKPVLISSSFKETNNITNNLDKIRQHNQTISIRGWAFSDDERKIAQSTSLIFLGNNQSFIVENIPTEIRNDVSAYFKKQLNDSGFKVDIDISELPEDIYHIGILIQKSGKDYFFLTDEKFEKKKQ